MTSSRSTGLHRLSGLRTRSQETAAEMQGHRERFAVLADPSTAPKAISAAQLFQTPPALAARIADMFPSFGRTLEPSAGLGRLYAAIRERDTECPITMIDAARECADVLKDSITGDEFAEVVHGDFLECDPAKMGKFDSILMNPPFVRGSDIKHIGHALRFLKPGAMLVSVCANGPRQQSTLKVLASEWIPLPASSFRSEGTEVETALFVFRNPCTGLRKV